MTKTAAKMIAITQRQIVVGEHRERRDSLSADWYRLAEELGVHLLALPNRPAQALKMLQHCGPDGLILSNGEDIPLDCNGRANEASYSDRDNTEIRLLDYAIQAELPVLGVCRGCQFIALMSGGCLSEIVDGGHVAQNHDVSMHFPDWDLTSRTVNSFHRYRIEQYEATKFDVLANDNRQGVEALKIPGKPVWGIMWHPEREYFTANGGDGFNQYLFHQVFGL